MSTAQRSSRMPATASARAALVRKVGSEKATAPRKSAPPARRPAPPAPLPIEDGDIPPSDHDNDSEDDDLASMMSEDTEKLAAPTKNVAKPPRVSQYGKERRSKGVRTVPSSSKAPADEFSAEILFLETVKDTGIHRTVGSTDNYFSLNCWLMFEYLHVFYMEMNDNPKVEKYFKWFNPLAFSAYITFLINIQIIRAQVAVKRVQSTADSKFVRAFLRDFPEESLVIPGFLVPFFNQIAGVILDDPKYGNIAPRKCGPVAQLNNFETALGTDTNYPVFHAIAIGAARFASDHLYDSAAHDSLIPFNTTGDAAADTTYLKVNWDTVAHATAVRINAFFNRPGMNYGFDFAETEDLTAVTNNSAKYVHSRSKKAALAQRFQPLIAKVETLVGNENLASMSDKLLASQDYMWFRCLLTHATEVCKFAKGISNLSKIDTTTGLSRSFKGRTDDIPAGNPWLIAPTAVAFNGRFGSFKSSFYSIRGECSDLDARKALMTAICCNGPANRYRHVNAAGSENAGPLFDATTRAAAEIITDSTDPTPLIQTLLKDKQYITNPY